LGNILGYSPVLAGEYSPTWRVYTNRARAQYLMDYKFQHIGGTFFHFHWCWGEQLLVWKFSFKEVEESQISTVKRFSLFLQSIILTHFIDCGHLLSVHTCQVQKLINFNLSLQSLIFTLEGVILCDTVVNWFHIKA